MVSIVLVLHLSLWGATGAAQAWVGASLPLPAASPTSGDEPYAAALQKHSAEKIKPTAALERQRNSLGAHAAEQVKSVAKQKVEKLIHKKALRGTEVSHRHVQKEEAGVKAAAPRAGKKAQRQKQLLAKREQAEKEERLQKLRARWQEVQAEANAPEEVRKQHLAAAQASKKAALEEQQQEGQPAKQAVREEIRRAKERADPAREAKEAALRHKKALAADSLSMTMKLDGKKEVELKVSKDAPAYILLPTAAHLLHIKEAEVHLKHGENELSLSESMGRQGLKDGDVITPVVS